MITRRVPSESVLIALAFGLYVQSNWHQVVCRWPLFYFILKQKKHKINQQLQQYNQNSKGKEEEGEDTDYILNFTGAFEDEVAGSFICKNRTNSETESPRESVQINFTTQYRKAAGGMVFVLEGSSIQRLRFNF